MQTQAGSNENYLWTGAFDRLAYQLFNVYFEVHLLAPV